MIIDVRDQTVVLDCQPRVIRIVLSLEIVVELSDRRYLLVRYPYYALGDQRANEIGEGQWYPPFVGFTAETSTYAPQTVGDLINITEKRLADVNVDRELNELAHAAGFGAPTLTQCGTIFEVKNSPTSGDHCHAYRIERYKCRPRGLSQIRNITDPECLKGHAFLPLEDKEDRLPKINIRGDQRTFLGKPLVSNLQSLIEDPVELGLLRDSPIQTTTDSWTRAESGFLILVDIAGFGAACQFAVKKLPNMFESGENIASRFRLTVGECFQSIFLEVGIAQSYFTGDGFIAAIPDRLSQDERCLSKVRLFFDSYLRFVETLTKMNERIAHGNIQIGSRIAFHYGAYRFGRIGGPTSLAANFDGDPIIEVARTEAALSKFSKTSESPPSLHGIAMTSSAYDKMQDIEEIASVTTELKSLTYTVKERAIEARAGYLKLGPDW